MKIKGLVSVLLAYPAAAASGAVVVALEFAAFALIGTPSGLAEAAAGWWVVPVAWLYGFIVFLFGLLVIGTPVWLAMAGLKRDRRHDAVIAGAVLSALAGFLVMQLFSGEAWTWGATLYGAALVLPGAVAGWVLHRVAYGPVP